MRLASGDLKHRPVSALLLLAAALPALESDALAPWQDSVWGLRWNERLAQAGDPGMMSPGSTLLRPVASGLWGEAMLGAQAASHGRAAPLPGLDPVPRGASALAELRLDAAGPGWWMHLAANGTLASASGRKQEPAADPRAQWTGRETDSGAAPADGHLCAELGLAGLRHALSIGNRPLHWGPGILGGVVFGRAPVGIPHAALATSEPWLLSVTDGGTSVLLMTETVFGSRDGTSEGPWLAGQRFQLRLGALELGASGAWTSDESGSQSAAEDTRHAAIAGDLALTLFGSACASFEVGRRRGDHGEAASALCWVATIDIFDLDGDGRWRVAGEWQRSGDSSGLPGVGGWSGDGVPLAHADGDNSQSISAIVQHRLDDGGAFALVGAWRQRGRVDADGQAASDRYPSRTWTTWSLDSRLDLPLGDFGADDWTLGLFGGWSSELSGGFASADPRGIISGGADLRWMW